MSYDDWTREYQLTPRGWINGTYRHHDGIRGAEVTRPDDAVETWEEHGDQHSGWSRETRTSRLISLRFIARVKRFRGSCR